MQSEKPTTVAAYIAGYPEAVREKLEAIRAAIKTVTPDAVEAIKYDIPTFVLNGNMISYAAFKNHIGVYPAPREVPEFKEELAKYKGNKSTVQFPLNSEVPLDLIARIVKFRAEVLERKKK